MHTIIGLQIKDRKSLAEKVQKLLSQYGCYIKTRIGLHDVHDNICSGTGIILLEMFGDNKKIKEFQNKISKLSGVTLKKMIFK